MVLGLFTASMESNVMADGSIREQSVREVMKDLRKRGHSYGKNFAIVGAMFACTDCAVETVSFLKLCAVNMLMSIVCVCVCVCVCVRLEERVTI